MPHRPHSSPPLLAAPLLLMGLTCPPGDIFNTTLLLSQMTDAFRATGLQSSMSIVVPVAILITGVALWFAARRFVGDAAKVSGAAAAAPTVVLPGIVSPSKP